MQKNFSLKYGMIFLACLCVRVLPWRAPNAEPIMATVMPMAKKFGAFSGFLFGGGSIVVYDLVTNTLGMWTLVDALAYGVVGMAAAWILRGKGNTRSSYLFYAIFGTLFYDAITGLLMGPLFFRQPFMAALLGQIPFTFLHLLGNSIFAVVLSPVLFAWIAKEVTPEARVHLASALLKN